MKFMLMINPVCEETFNAFVEVNNSFKNFLDDNFVRFSPYEENYRSYKRIFDFISGNKYNSLAIGFVGIAHKINFEANSLAELEFQIRDSVCQNQPYFEMAQENH